MTVHPPETPPALLLIHPSIQTTHLSVHSPCHTVHLSIHISITLGIPTYPISPSPTLPITSTRSPINTHPTGASIQLPTPFVFPSHLCQLLKIPTNLFIHCSTELHYLSIQLTLTFYLFFSHQTIHSYMSPQTPTPLLVCLSVLHRTPTHLSTRYISPLIRTFRYPSLTPQPMQPLVLAVFHQPHPSTISVPQPP